MSENAETETVSRHRQETQVFSLIKVSGAGPKCIQILPLYVSYSHIHT